jgi:hypothetical protein
VKSARDKIGLRNGKRSAIHKDRATVKPSALRFVGIPVKSAETALGDCDTGAIDRSWRLIAMRKAACGCGRDEEGDNGHSSGDPKNPILLESLEAMGGSDDISQRSIVIVHETF